jgi:hypothetical protein
MVIPHTLTAAAHNMHLAPPRPSILLVVPTTPRVITDTTRHTLLSTVEEKYSLFENYQQQFAPKLHFAYSSTGYAAQKPFDIWSGPFEIVIEIDL